MLVNVIPILWLAGPVGAGQCDPNWYSRDEEYRSILAKKGTCFWRRDFGRDCGDGSAHSGKPEVLLGVLPDTYIARIDT